jgi:hypothetical protein
MVLTNIRTSTRVPRAVLPVLVALLVGLWHAAAADATCYSSTPATAAFNDPAFDGDGGLAPEITTVSASLDASCRYAVDPAIAQPLVDGDAVFEYVNVDGNAATGSPLFHGADVAVGSVGLTGPDPSPILGSWDPGTSSFSFATGPSVSTVGIGGFAASLDQLGFTSPGVSTVQVASIWAGVYDNYLDFAPEPSALPLALSVGFSTLAPPPPPPPPAPVVPVVTPVAAPVGEPAPVTVAAPVTATAKACTIPRLKRLRTAAATTAIRHAGCKVGLTRRAYSSSIAAGRVIASSPKAGTTWTEPVDLVISRGRKPKQRHRAHRASASDVRDLLEMAARQLDAQR